MHPLTLLATGLYGQELPPQDGAPVRLVVPWKYGFKGIKSIVKITLAATQPPTTWNIAAPDEYGFFANVNPQHDHPRWSQATEQRIGEIGPARHAAVQRLRRSGREPLRRAWTSMSTSERLVRHALREAADASSTALVPAALLAWDAWHGPARRQRRQLRDPHDRPGRPGAAHAVARSSRRCARSPAGTGSSRCAATSASLGFAYLAAHFPIFFLFDRQASVASTVHEIVDAPLSVVRDRRARADDPAGRDVDRRHGRAARRDARGSCCTGSPTRSPSARSCTTTCWSSPTSRQPLAFAAVIGVLLLYRVVAHYLRLRAAAARRAATAPRRRGRHGDEAALWSGELVIARIFDETPDVKTFRLAAGRRRAAAVHARRRPVPEPGADDRRPARQPLLHDRVVADARRLLRDLGQARPSGYGSRHLHDAWREGQRVKVSAPAGKFVFAGHGVSASC